MEEVANFKVNFKLVSSMSTEISDDKGYNTYIKLPKYKDTQNPNTCFRLKYKSKLNFNLKNEKNYFINIINYKISF